MPWLVTMVDTTGQRRLSMLASPFLCASFAHDHWFKVEFPRSRPAQRPKSAQGQRPSPEQHLRYTQLPQLPMDVYGG
jgi:hypothetical protein